MAGAGAEAAYRRFLTALSMAFVSEVKLMPSILSTWRV